ncbi:hypothetical protein BDZ91DRAFT_401577 [Kalaharituber pfeilii]|nr:hypothetical protein BDZ91DRAFT_401577 [Kalaharituber pfeilii]
MCTLSGGPLCFFFFPLYPVSHLCFVWVLWFSLPCFRDSLVGTVCYLSSVLSNSQIRFILADTEF